MIMIVIVIEIPQELPLAKIAKNRQEVLTTKSAEGATELFPLERSAIIRFLRQRR